MDAPQGCGVGGGGAAGPADAGRHAARQVEAHRRQQVVDQQELDQQRDAAEEAHEQAARQRHGPAPRQHRGRDQEADRQPGHDGHRAQRDREPRGLDEEPEQRRVHAGRSCGCPHSRLGMGSAGPSRSSLPWSGREATVAPGRRTWPIMSTQIRAAAAWRLPGCSEASRGMRASAWDQSAGAVTASRSPSEAAPNHFFCRAARRPSAFILTISADRASASVADSGAFGIR